MTHALLDHLTRTLGPLPPPAAALCQGAQPLSMSKGQALLHEGERWQHLWWLERGAMRLVDALNLLAQFSRERLGLTGAGSGQERIAQFDQCRR